MLVIQNPQLEAILRKLAHDQHLPIETVLQNLLPDNLTSEPSSAPSLEAGTSAWILHHLAAVTFATDQPLDPSAADDILRRELAEYLSSRDV